MTGAAEITGMAEQPSAARDTKAVPCVRYPGFEHPEGACGCFHGGRPPVHGRTSTYVPTPLPRPRAAQD